jgi:hypothetical protein
MNCPKNITQFVMNSAVKLYVHIVSFFPCTFFATPIA